jgi:membrane carboxypeptidase/penicillin-binding protein PbpC
MVKTGTTNDKRDNWTIGGNGNAMVGVWVGNNDNSPMLNVASGISGASPIWHKIIQAVMANKPKLAFDIPEGVVTAQVDSVSGYAAHDGFPSRPEVFVKGTEPTGTDPVHAKLKVCKSDGNLANPSDVAAGNYDSKEYFVFKEEDPTAGSSGANKWQEGILNWLNSQGDTRYKPPTSYCGTSNPLNVDFISPTDQTSDIPTGDYTVAYRANSSSGITQSSLKLNGNQICGFSSGSNNYTCNVSFPNKGIYTLEATASDSTNHQSNRVITVGVGQAWNATPTP